VEAPAHPSEEIKEVVISRKDDGFNFFGYSEDNHDWLS
jgi:hypothetical protein